MTDEETGDWSPPNEAEMKVLEAKRERNNQISRLMANYMLKGIILHVELVFKACILLVFLIVPFKT